MADQPSGEQPQPLVPPPQQPAAPPPQEIPAPQPGYYSQVPPPGYYQQAPGYYQQQPQNDAIQTLIPTQNPPSLVSYYCGVFSFVVCAAPILSPIAIIAGIIALNKIKAQPGLKGKGHAITGIVCGIITILIFTLGVAALFASSQHQPD